MARRSQATSQIVTIPAPKRGWNARDPLSAMKPDHAVVLENMIPSTGGVELRFGHDQRSYGIGTRIETLMQYSGPDGANELFAASNGKIFDVTGSGVIDPDLDFVLDGLSESYFSHTMSGNAGGNYLTACNGSDAVIQYDGSTWDTPVITGVDSDSLNFVHPHVKRLWFLERNSTRAWHLAVDAIQGAATEFDISSELPLGGYLVAMASWTRDGGSGADDLAVFISSKGEVAIYSGIDPDTDFAKVGTFKIPAPIGRRCVLKLGADVIVLTGQGPVPLSKVLAASSGEAQRLTISNDIDGAFNSAYLTAGVLEGWQTIEYARKQLLIVNIPKANGVEFEQFVMNEITSGWCKFTGWHATCWSLLGENLFFGTVDGRVCMLSDTYLDNGDPIIFDALPAFFDFGNANVKYFKQARGLFTAVQGTDPPFEMKTDYDLSAATVSQGEIPLGGTPWGSPWGSPWGPPIVQISNYQSIIGHGVVGAPRLKGVSRSSVRWHQTTVVYEVGGPY